MTTAAGTRPTTEPVRTAQGDSHDRRRITERDPDVARLRTRTVSAFG